MTATRPRVLGAGHDGATDEFFLSLETPGRAKPSSRFYLDRTQALVTIRTLAAALEISERETT